MDNGNDNDNVIVLTDGEGQELECEFLDTVEYGDKEYAIFYPVGQDEDEGEVVILEIVETSEDTEEYVPVEDEALLDRVFEEYMRLSQIEEDELDD